MARCTSPTTAVIVSGGVSTGVTIQYNSPGTIDCTVATPTTLQTVTYQSDANTLWRCLKAGSPVPANCATGDPVKGDRLTGQTIGTLTFRYFGCGANPAVDPPIVLTTIA